MKEAGAKRLGTLASFLARHDDIVGGLVLKGAARYGNITLARAVRLCALTDTSPKDALARSVEIGRSLRCAP